MKIRILAETAKVYQDSRGLRVYRGTEVDCDDEIAKRLIERGEAEGASVTVSYRDPEPGDEIEHRDPAPARRRRGKRSD